MSHKNLEPLKDGNLDQLNEVQASFEKIRFDYCVNIFNKEEARRENLEKKAQFYLSFVTLFLGALFLQIDNLTDIRTIISRPGTSATMILTNISVIILGVFLLAAIITILLSVRLRDYQAEFPEEFSEALFSTSKGFIKTMEESTLLKNTAMAYALAVEANRKTNEKKAKWLIISAYCIFFAVLSFAMLLMFLFLG